MDVFSKINEMTPIIYRVADAAEFEELYVLLTDMLTQTLQGITDEHLDIATAKAYAALAVGIRDMARYRYCVAKQTIAKEKLHGPKSVHANSNSGEQLPMGESSRQTASAGCLHGSAEGGQSAV